MRQVVDGDGLAGCIGSGRGVLSVVSGRTGARLDLRLGAPPAGKAGGKRGFERPVFVHLGHRYGDGPYLGAVWVPSTARAGGWSYHPKYGLEGHEVEQKVLAYLVRAVNRREVPGDMEVWYGERAER